MAITKINCFPAKENYKHEKSEKKENIFIDCFYFFFHHRRTEIVEETHEMKRREEEYI